MTRTIDELKARPCAKNAELAVGDDRLPGIDRMRGLVILLMALDHVRDFFCADTFHFSPTDLAHTYPALFLTRFITHFCAPTFVLLAGVSAFLHGTKLHDRKALAIFLLTRGAWLILLDVFVVSPVWALGSGKFYLGTLWAIGVGVIALSPLVFLPARAALAIGALILFGHNLFDRAQASAFGDFAPLWRILHEQGPAPFGLNGQIIYPVLPWIAIMALGYGLGPLFLESSARRGRRLLLLGTASIALFFLLRLPNFYGDPVPWASQPDGVMTALSFINVSKYPPSLLYALLTLGPALLLLPAMERLGGRLGETLDTFGRVPLFVYVLHLYAALAAAVALWLALGFTPDDLLGLRRHVPEGLGLSLAGTYVAWIVIMAALYPLCRWFANVKRRRRDWWLSYL